MKPFIKLSILLIVIFGATAAVVLFRFYGSRRTSLSLNNPESVSVVTVSSIEIPTEYQDVLVVYSTGDSNSQKTYDNIRRVFEMAKIHARYVPASVFTQSDLSALSGDDLCVIATEMANMLPSVVLHGFVRNGGRLVFLTRNSSHSFNDLVGITVNNGYLDAVSGIRFVKSFFPGLDSLELEKSLAIGHSSIDVRLDPDVELYAKAGNDIPLLWKYKYGKGTIVYFNSTLANYKGNRGILLQVIALAPDYFLQTVANTKVVTIDDFPAPIKKGKDEIIYNHYLMDNTSFYRLVWWSSMYSLARKYNLRFTGMLTGTYNLTVSAPFEPISFDETDDIQYFGLKLLENKGEIGLHGYNHNSLALKDQMLFDDYGYSPWESQSAMEIALGEVRSVVKNLFGQLRITAYVPPSNILSKDGKQAVRAVFPDIRVIAGLYTGFSEKGILYQEFGPDPDIEGVYDFPRISAGYIYSPEDMWNIYNGIAHYGLVNHFIHPDDLLDSNRSGKKTWKELYSDIDKMFGEIHGYFPNLQPRTVTMAADDCKNNEALKVYSSRINDVIYIRHIDAVMPVYHYLRINAQEKAVAIEGGTLKLIADTDEYRLYLIIADKAEVKVMIKAYE